jgi:hypothetical protein
MWVAGRDASARFYETRVRDAMAAHHYVTRAVEANGGLGIAIYAAGEPGQAYLVALQVLEEKTAW